MPGAHVRSPGGAERSNDATRHRRRRYGEVYRARDTRLDQLLVRDRLHIGGTDLLEHVAEQVELLIGVVVCVIARLPDGSRQPCYAPAQTNGIECRHECIMQEKENQWDYTAS